MKAFGGTTLQIDRAMVLSGIPTNQAYIQFADTDLDTPGSYNAEIEITFADTKILRTIDRLIIVITPEVVAS
jgi:hypothetical protein